MNHYEINKQGSGFEDSPTGDITPSVQKEDEPRGCCTSVSSLDMFIRSTVDDDGCVRFIKLIVDYVFGTGCDPTHPEIPCEGDWNAPIISNHEVKEYSLDGCDISWRISKHGYFGDCHCVGHGTSIDGGSQVVDISLGDGQCMQCEDVLDYLTEEGHIDTFVPDPHGCCGWGGGIDPSETNKEKSMGKGLKDIQQNTSFTKKCACVNYDDINNPWCRDTLDIYCTGDDEYSIGDSCADWNKLPSKKMNSISNPHPGPPPA